MTDYSIETYRKYIRGMDDFALVAELNLANMQMELEEDGAPVMVAICQKELSERVEARR